MRVLRFVCFFAATAIIGSCAESQQSDTGRSNKKKLVSDGGQGGHDGTGVGDKKTVFPTSADCDSQWALALKQQPVGATFAYKTDIAISASGFPIAKSVTRNEEIKASGDGGITRLITISDTQVAALLPNLKAQSLTLTKEKFLQTCKAANGQPVTFTGLGGDIKVDSPTNTTLNIQGQQVNVMRFTAKLNNISYSGYSLTEADAVTYVSAEYPALPLKQELEIIKASIQLLNGATINETLTSNLPAK